MRTIQMGRKSSSSGDSPSTKEGALFATPGGRGVFLRPEVVPYAVELARSIRASIRRVLVPGKVRLCGLRGLARNLADAAYAMPDVVFQDLGAMDGCVVSFTRADIAARSRAVRDHVRSELEAGRGVSLSALAERFADKGYSRPSLKYHLGAVRSELEAAGRPPHKVGADYFLDSKED